MIHCKLKDLRGGGAAFEQQVVQMDGRETPPPPRLPGPDCAHPVSKQHLVQDPSLHSQAEPHFVKTTFIRGLAYRVLTTESAET